MNSCKKNISSSILLKISLILSVFVFTGYNDGIYAAPLEAVKTELVISDTSNTSDRICSFDQSIKTSKVSFSLFLIQPIDPLCLYHNYFSSIVVKTQSSIFEDFKKDIFINQISNQGRQAYLIEDRPIAEIG